MKILFATHFFPPGHAGGTESYTLGLAKQLARLGHLPQVVCAEDWGTGSNWRPHSRDSDHDGIPVRRLAWNWGLAPDPFVGLYNNPEVERHLAAYLDQLRPDVMHITSCYSLGAGVIRAAHSAGIPTVLTLTDFWFISPRQTLIRGDGSLCQGPTSALDCALCLAAGSTVHRTLARRLPAAVLGHGLTQVGRWPLVARQKGLRGYVGNVAKRRDCLRHVFDRVDVAFVPSEALKTVFVHNGYPPERLELSRYGLDLSWTAAVRRKPLGDRFCVGYVGQIEPMKGVDVLINAFRSVHDPAWELKVFGGLDKNPTYTERLRHLGAGDPNIRFMGQFERGQIADALSGLDVLVVPSVWLENAPVVISEAFAAGRTVIATDLPGMSELVSHDVNGLVFPRADVPALAAALRRMADEPGLRDRLVAGIQPVRTIEDEADALVDRYRSLVHART